MLAAMPQSLRDEAVRLLQDLLCVNTVNPPGNETAAAELLRAYLEENGVACELYARDPARANLVARIPGSGDGSRLLLLSHTDTVLADPAEWTVDPWCGHVKDGCVWGRGALDMKGQVAASALAIASLAREGFQPAGDLIFAATADEEVGDAQPKGLEWLCEAHPDAVRCDYAINEGAGDRLELGGRVFYTCAAAEKVSSPFTMIVQGRSGHAALPGIADNALVRAARLIERIAEYREEPRLGVETEAFLATVTGSVPPAGDALEMARVVDPAAAEILEPLLTTTLSPTMITASDKRNVIPGLCEVIVDCRLLPGDSQERLKGALRAWLDSEEHELVWRRPQGGTRSRLDTPLWSAIETFVGSIEPRAAVAPLCVAGFTDSHWLRASFDAVVYGFFPQQEMSAELAARLVHSADERIAVADLEVGVDFLRHAAQEICR
jgi:acetylornithine deacetylase/succinyl-diaminopimelate desuccinylase-like protein